MTDSIKKSCHLSNCWGKNAILHGKENNYQPHTLDPDIKKYCSVLHQKEGQKKIKQSLLLAFLVSFLSEMNMQYIFH
jgi:hypothetical protein